MKSPERSPHIYGNLTGNRDALADHWEKINGAKTRNSHIQKLHGIGSLIHARSIKDVCV